MLAGSNPQTSWMPGGTPQAVKLLEEMGFACGREATTSMRRRFCGVGGGETGFEPSAALQVLCDILVKAEAATSITWVDLAHSWRICFLPALEGSLERAVELLAT